MELRGEGGELQMFMSLSDKIEKYGIGNFLRFSPFLRGSCPDAVGRGG